VTVLERLPGDAALLAGNARLYKTISESLSQASRDLQSVANDSVFISLAVDEIREEATQAGNDAHQIYVRYSGTASALADYAVQLRAAQDRADSAIRAHSLADADRIDWVVRREYYEDMAKEPGEDIEAWKRLERGAQEEVDSARDRAESAIYEYNAAVEDRDRAAEAAAARIADAQTKSHLNNTLIDEIRGRWEDFKKWSDTYLVPILEAIRDVCDKMSEIVGTVALVLTFLSFLPFVGLVAAALAGLAKALSTAALLATVLLVLMGKQSVTDLFKKLIGIAVGKLLNFGGKLAASAGLSTAKAGLSAAQSITGKQTGETAAQNLINYRIAAGIKGVADGGLRILRLSAKKVIGADVDFLMPNPGPNNAASAPLWNPPPHFELPTSVATPVEAGAALGQQYDLISDGVRDGSFSQPMLCGASR